MSGKKQNQIESVYIVPRKKLFNGRPIPQGFHTRGLKQLIQKINQCGKFIKRPRAEYDPSLKQIIPYAFVSFGSPHKTIAQHSRNNRDVSAAPQFLLLRRKGTQTEKRLHNKYSLGVGGHINPIEKVSVRKHNRGKTIIESGLERELFEELSITCNYAYKPVGYLNDDTNSVGQVHFGLVYQITVTTKKGVAVAEKDLMSGRFLTIKQIRKYYPLMETWSQIIFDRLLLKKR